MCTTEMERRWSEVNGTRNMKGDVGRLCAAIERQLKRKSVCAHSELSRGRAGEERRRKDEQEKTKTGAAVSRTREVRERLRPGCTPAPVRLIWT